MSRGPARSPLENETTAGSLLVTLSYVSWGLLPLYWKLLAGVGSLEVLAHRVLWTVAFCLAALLATRRKLADILQAPMPRSRLLLAHLASGVLLSGNWLTYVYAVFVGRVVEASMGYYINPLLSVLLAVLVLGERLRPAQVAATALALAGVVVMSLSYGKVPWIAVSLALTFALYGLLKKRMPVDALRGLFLETTLVFPLALAYVGFLSCRGQLGFAAGPAGRSILLAAAGPITGIPLVWFASGARRIPLARVGFLQYLSPTLQLLVGVLAFHEPFTATHAVSFGLIWAGVAVYLGSTIRWRRTRRT